MRVLIATVTAGAGHLAAAAALNEAWTTLRPQDEVERLDLVKFFSPLHRKIVSDFEAHALWMDPGVDLYCVAAEETKARLVARGASPASVIATGIPISSRFSAIPDLCAIRKVLGLRDDLPVLLVLSGGFGMGP